MYGDTVPDFRTAKVKELFVNHDSLLFAGEVSSPQPALCRTSSVTSTLVQSPTGTHHRGSSSSPSMTMAVSQTRRKSSCQGKVWWNKVIQAPSTGDQVRVLQWPRQSHGWRENHPAKVKDGGMSYRDLTTTTLWTCIGENASCPYSEKYKGIKL